VVVTAGTGGVVVDSQVFKFKQLVEFWEFILFGQFRAMWPWVQHLKQHPSTWYLVCSSSVNLQKGADIFAESMSMGTCWLFDKEWDACWFPVWYACWSRDWFRHGPMSPALCNSLIWPTSLHAASFHCAIVVGKFSQFTTQRWTFSQRPARYRAMVPFALASHLAKDTSLSNVML
jgi:hypothetical protein